MPGFTTTDDGSWSFSFSDDQARPELPSEPNMATGYLSGPGKWDNWSDGILYECDSLVRQFLESKLDDPQWTCKSARHRRFTMAMVFEIIFGRKYDGKADAAYSTRLPKVLAYYSTRVQKSGSINGKSYTKTVYVLSLKRYKTKPPYSLRLRLEWLEARGELPTWHNMKLPSDDLQPGHARNKRTNENMERRRELARKRYNERYADRSH